jgi:hypothetical protein
MGDGFCDDGEFGPNLYCAEFAYDSGDCDLSGPDCDTDPEAESIVCSGSFEVRGASSALEIEELKMCGSITGDLTIRDTTLTNLDCLSRLTSVNMIDIVSNTRLANIDGLSNLTSVSDLVWVRFNDALVHIDGLSGVTGSVERLIVQDNPVLINIDSLMGITEVTRHIRISDNPEITQVDGLSNITTVGNYMHVYRNDALTNLDGLSSLSVVGDDVTIRDNPSLCQSLVDAFIDLISALGWTGTALITDNADC